MEVNKPLPLISIIVPIYNIAEYASECIQSLINQTYKNIEIILVDDGSTDHSPVICDEFAEQDERIKVIHKRNGGLSDARNAGLDVATENTSVLLMATTGLMRICTRLYIT